jgi:acetolactate synthase I/II/III large subunit
MHFVAALDKAPGMRCVLGLAETVVTGCADGYARMSGRAAATLLHCGPGFANGIANLHNARRAHSPVVNIVGDHATYHRPFDPPLAADTQGLVRAISHWTRVASSPASVGGDAADAVQAANTSPGKIASLILPADMAWNDGGVEAAPRPVPRQPRASAETVREIAGVLRHGERVMLVLAGEALSEAGLMAAQRIAATTNCKLRVPTQVARMARGSGRPRIDRIPYSVDAAVEVMSAVEHVVLVAATAPVAFFAYPGKPSLIAPAASTTHVLAHPYDDAVDALEQLADALGAPRSPAIPRANAKPRIATGPFDVARFGETLAALIPADGIVVEEAVTSGRQLFPPTFDAAPHDWLQITGGAIGHGFPCATGAAIASPGRRVICLQADGGGMYSLQSLWTQARERLDVVNIVFANRMYKILLGELVAVGAVPGPASKDLFDLRRPDLDWVKLAGGMGVEAARVETLEAFADVFAAACRRRGPYLIELVI